MVSELVNFFFADRKNQLAKGRKSHETPANTETSAVVQKSLKNHITHSQDSRDSLLPI
jgi:hypothetical protein